MKIGFVCKPEVFNIQYRAAGPAEALHRRGHHVALALQNPDDSLDARPLHDCDIVHIYRCNDATVQRCVTDLQRRGVAITWDDDDDLRLMPPDTRRRVLRMDAAAARRAFENATCLIRRADVVTTPSVLLAKRYRAAGAARVVRIENHLVDGQYAEPATDHDGLVIGWVAAAEHDADARALRVSRMLQRVMDRHPHVRVVTVGVRLDLRGPRYTHHPGVTIRKLSQTLRQWDVGIAPIGNIPMSYARSNVKVKEYAAAGLPWLASARGPYIGLGPEQGGVLVADDGWEEVLDRILASHALRENLRRRAQAWARSQSIHRHADAWLSVFGDAVRTARERRPAATDGLAG